MVERFEQQPADEPAFFGHLPNRAKYTAGLYWHLLQKQQTNNKYVKQRLFDNFPPQAKTIGSKMQQEPEFAETAKNWCDRFEKEARALAKMVGKRTGLI